MIDRYMHSGRGTLLCALVAVVGLSACHPATEQDTRHTLVIGKAGDIGTVDPAATVVSNDFGPLDLAYERLVRFEVRDGMPTGELRPELATSWTSDADGRTWMFMLQPGHRFDDGSEVTAHAVRFSFERCAQLRLGPAQALEGLAGIDALDDYTVRFRFAAPVPIFPLIAALPPMAVVNPNVLQHQQGKDLARGWLSQNTSGSGPYKVTAWQRGQRVELKRNAFSSTRPRYFQRVVFKIIRDDASRRVQLRKGDIDIYEGVTPEVAALLAGRPGVRMIEQATPYVIAMAMNNERPRLAEASVRKAIAQAIDAAAISKSVVGGRASLMHGVLPPGVPGHDATISVIERDLTKSRDLLRAAGVPEGTRLTLSYVPASALTETTALVIQSQLRDVGLQVQLEPLAPSAFSKVTRGDFDLALASWVADFPDPWPIMQFAYNSANKGEGYNLARYSNTTVDQLLNTAQTTLDRERRVALYREAQAIVVAEQPMVGLFAVHGLLAYRASIAGLVYNFWQPGTYPAAQMFRDDLAGSDT
jgi:peptide/nickel transport system substrate-binding protein